MGYFKMKVRQNFRKMCVELDPESYFEELMIWLAKKELLIEGEAEKEELRQYRQETIKGFAEKSINIVNNIPRKYSKGNYVPQK